MKEPSCPKVSLVSVRDEGFATFTVEARGLNVAVNAKSGLLRLFAC